MSLPAGVLLRLGVLGAAASRAQLTTVLWGPPALQEIVGSVQTMCCVGQHVWVGFANGMLSILNEGAVGRKGRTACGKRRVLGSELLAAHEPVACGRRKSCSGGGHLSPPTPAARPSGHVLLTSCRLPHPPSTHPHHHKHTPPAPPHKTYTATYTHAHTWPLQRAPRSRCSPRTAPASSPWRRRAAAPTRWPPTAASGGGAPACPATRTWRRGGCRGAQAQLEQLPGQPWCGAGALRHPSGAGALEQA